MLKEKLQNDIKEALKSGNSARRMVIGLVMSAIKSRELDKRAKLSKIHSASSGQAELDPSKLEESARLTDEEVVEAISSEIKKRREAIEQYVSGGREELAQKERDEIVVLMEYMPEQMSEDQVRGEVKKAIKDLGAAGVKDTGKVIGSVMSKIKGKADGTLVSKIVKEELAG